MPAMGYSGGLITSCCQIVPPPVSSDANKHALQPLRPPPRLLENRICDSLLSSQKHTDLIITSRLADGALHLRLRGEFFQKDNNNNKKKKKVRKKKERNGYGEVKESEIWQLITGGTNNKSCIWRIIPGRDEEKRNLKKGRFFFCTETRANLIRVIVVNE